MIYWTIGLSGAGKTSAFYHIQDELIAPIQIIDGDCIRATINQDLGFSDEDKRENHRRVAELVKIIHSQGKGDIYVAMITPTTEIRTMIKSILTDSVRFIYFDTTVEECKIRSQKRIYDSCTQIAGVDARFDIPDRSEIDLTLKIERDFKYLSKLIKFINYEAKSLSGIKYDILDLAMRLPEDYRATFETSNDRWLPSYSFKLKRYFKIPVINLYYQKTIFEIPYDEMYIDKIYLKLKEVIN